MDGVNCTWTRDFAWNALVWEDRLEMAMEGRRFYDLVRWGMAEKVMNAYFDKESQRRSWLNVAHFTAGSDEYLPIPQAQMNWSRGGYKQNTGY
ncbi:MAG: RagB/SusD family nutrient uptake outer membrane protein [Segetibacter sp.]